MIYFFKTMRTFIVKNRFLFSREGIPIQLQPTRDRSV